MIEFREFIRVNYIIDGSKAFTTLYGLEHTGLTVYGHVSWQP